MKQHLVIFLVCFLSLFFLGSGLLGVNGFFYNQELKKQIREVQYNKDKLEQDIVSLQEEKTHLASEEGLRDLAIDLGYYVEGETVYLFNEPSLQSDSKETITGNDVKSFIPLSSSTILLFDFGISCIITFVIWLLSRNSKSNNDNSYDDTTDLDIYINA